MPQNMKTLHEQELKLHIDGCITPLLPSEITFLLQTSHTSHNVIRFFFLLQNLSSIRLCQTRLSCDMNNPIFGTIDHKILEPAMNNHLFW